MELTDGAFNALYALTLDDGQELVLNVVPGPDAPLPRFRAGDPDRGYLLVDKLPGQPLETAKPTMAPAQLAEVRRALGATCARLHTLTSPWFGYPVAGAA